MDGFGGKGCHGEALQRRYFEAEAIPTHGRALSAPSMLSLNPRPSIGRETKKSQKEKPKKAKARKAKRLKIAVLHFNLIGLIAAYLPTANAIVEVLQLRVICRICLLPRL